MVNSTKHLFYRVYFKDTDAGGVMYHGRYLELLDMGRTELLRDHGFSVQSLFDEKKILFPVYEIKINYLKPAFLDDLLNIEVNLDKIVGSKIFFSYQIRRDQDSPEQVIASANSINACVQAPELKPIRANRVLSF